MSRLQVSVDQTLELNYAFILFKYMGGFLSDLNGFDTFISRRWTFRTAFIFPDKISSMQVNFLILLCWTLASRGISTPSNTDPLRLYLSIA